MNAPITLDLNTSSSAVGTELEVTLNLDTSAYHFEKFTQCQIEIFFAGVPNPRLAYSTGSNYSTTDKHSFKIDTSPFPHGTYEVNKFVFHTPKSNTSDQRLTLTCEEDFPRLFFELTPSEALPKTQEELAAWVKKKEHEIKINVLKTIDIRKDHTAPSKQVTALVFIKNLLLGAIYQFENIKVFPTNQNLSFLDSCKVANDFLADNCKLQFHFDEKQMSSKEHSTISAAYFPSLLATSIEEAQEYVQQRTNNLLLAFSLVRSSPAKILNTVIIDPTNQQAALATPRAHYTGNLMTGALAGDSFEEIQGTMEAIGTSSYYKFLINSYKEALQEKSPDFQYVRLWQLLETIAESKNYNEKETLTNFEGNPILNDSGGKRKIKNSVPIVYNLLKEYQIGTSEETWERVNIWFAFRNATAHFGAISEFHKLRANVRKWALPAFKQIEKKDADIFLFILKDTVQSILRAPLTKTMYK